MLRRRLIACDRCSHLLLRRDNYCEACGRMTRQQSARLAVRVIPVCVILAAAVAFYISLRGH